MFAGLEQHFAHLVMSVGRGNYAQSVARLGGFFQGAKPANLMLTCQHPRDLAGNIIDSRELNDPAFRERGINARVLFAERTDANHGRLYSIAAHLRPTFWHSKPASDNWQTLHFQTSIFDA